MDVLTYDKKGKVYERMKFDGRKKAEACNRWECDL